MTGFHPNLQPIVDSKEGDSANKPNKQFSSYDEKKDDVKNWVEVVQANTQQKEIKGTSQERMRVDEAQDVVTTKNKPTLSP